MREQLPSEQRDRVTAATALLTERFLDSMGIVLLAAFVEERFGIRLDDAELRPGRLESVAGIVALLDGTPQGKRT